MAAPSAAPPLKKAFTFSKGVVKVAPEGEVPQYQEDDEEDEQEDGKQQAPITVDTLMVQYHKWITMRRVSYMILFLSEVVGLVCVAWPASLQLESGEGLGGQSELRELQTVRDNLIYYDEVLTMSARMCALSGKPEFAARYDAIVGPLEDNIARVLELQPDQADAFNAATVDANEELIRLETKALLGCAEGAERIPAAEAGEAVMGVEYELNKGSYVYGILTLKTGIDTYLQEKKDIDWQSTMFLWLVGIIVLLMLGAMQTAQQAQDEESERLAQNFDDQIDSLNDAQLVSEKVASITKSMFASQQQQQGNQLDSWKGAGDVASSKDVVGNNDVVAFGETPREGNNDTLSGTAPTPSNPKIASPKNSDSRVRARRHGCCGQLLEALSLRDFFVAAPRLKRRDRSYRFLRSWMPLVVFVSNIIALGCVLSPPFIQMETEEMVRMGHTLRELSELVSEITYYDEVLTSSARMCALTGDIRWMSRYLTNVGYIDSSINSVVTRIEKVQEKYPEINERFGGVNLGEFFLDTTDAANRKLIDLESAVIENCTHAALYRREDLFNDEYLTNKAVLLEGLDKLSTDVIQNVADQENQNLETVSISYFYVVIGLICFRGLSGLIFVYYCIRINWLGDKIKIHHIKKVVEDTLNKDTA
mmetsp:Transcript_40088/g.78545  ORF Transcript_40088/g.78545 Transcript_40088/m.78545 type:complete len:649 (+) Transcript_40088:383-2329(+)|eukprot:CAMPEP_0173413360 /NCGR_PEP_ID=MMETSP1356-20130122/81775_1 /TAXON_ID=77927 ORGANISM="Hemiselmis virescens, Strain PCC157" /NCGR_SAMPLE_ID=MMETSP1356 /ASSEMBLY_ACC=CAM_ASM_000847 /LENGTH=648 /DNA_ID=CAMNT_0014375389 /DNA_START=310 /DNA_END=2256 /DNA_ORIENTATION=+